MSLLAIKKQCFQHFGMRFMVDRYDWHTYFMSIAVQVATRSTCVKRQVGALLVKNRKIIGTGYNGSPSGVVHCIDVGCKRIQAGFGKDEGVHVCRSVHAEQNAIIQAGLYGDLVEGSTLYCTAKPCYICAKMIVNAAVSVVVCLPGRDDIDTDELFDDVGIEVVVLRNFSST